MSRRPSRHDLPAIQRLWEGALEILDGKDRDLQQRVAEVLSAQDYNGPDHIEKVMGMRASELLQKNFVYACRPFLQAMTHTNFVDSLSMRTNVDKIYLLMSDSGSRALAFFEHVCEIILEQLGDEVRPDPDLMQELETAAIATTEALKELIKRDAEVRSHEGLPAMVTFVTGLAHSFAAIGSPYTSQILLQQAGDLQAVVERKNGLATELANSVAGLSLGPGSTTACAAPKNTKPDNRHDNDKIDITEMSIFPTLGEVLSDVKECLPSTHPEAENCWNSKIQRHLDTHYRLFRHDIIGDLKTKLTSVMDYLRINPAQRSLGFSNTKDTYTCAVVQNVLFNSQRGLHVHISIPHPVHIRNRPVNERSRWWEQSGRLADGILLAFVWTESGQIRYRLLVSINQEVDKGENEIFDNGNQQKMFAAALLTQDETAVEDLVNLSCFRTSGMLVEFPNTIPATFVPVLENLQDMHRLSRLPFRQWIVPDRSAEQYMDVPPPLYARNPGFAFSLKPILLCNDAAPPRIDNKAVSNDKELLANMSAKTGLDLGQCDALTAALTREFAFIQGPPGTGKSYLGVKLMKVLLNSKDEADLGPIIVVCYTNHALDQFLEHLLSGGVDQIIRIGGGSRSETLANYNITVATQREMKTNAEEKQLTNAREELDKYVSYLEDKLTILESKLDNMTWETLDHHLQQGYLIIHNQLTSTDGGGGSRVGGHRFEDWSRNIFHQTKSDPPKASREQLAAILKKAAMNIYHLEQWERHSLVRLWSEELRRDLKKDLFKTLRVASEKQAIIQNVHAEVRRRVLQRADVVGMTTAGLAKNINILQRVRCKVIICEEVSIIAKLFRTTLT